MSELSIFQFVASLVARKLVGFDNLESGRTDTAHIGMQTLRLLKIVDNSVQKFMLRRLGGSASGATFWQQPKRIRIMPSQSIE